MPIEVIEENPSVAQIRIRCDQCGAYIGTRIIFQKELEAKKAEPLLCRQCKLGTGQKFSSKIWRE